MTSDDPFSDLELIKRHARHREGDWDIDMAEDSLGRPMDVTAYRELPDGNIEMLYVREGDVVSATYERPLTDAEIQRRDVLERISPGPPLGSVTRDYAREHRAMLIAVLLLVALYVGYVVWGAYL